MSMLAFDPGNHSAGDIYKLMIGAIVPRPIALVSSLDENNVRNLAPFSYFTACSSNPPVVVFCPILRPAPPQAKDTLRNIIATREFVVNIVSEDFARGMNATAAQVPPEVDEFELSGLTPIASELIKPPRVAESHIHMECRLLQTVQVSDKPGGGTPGSGRSAALSCARGPHREFPYRSGQAPRDRPHGRFDLCAHDRSFRARTTVTV